MSDEDNNGTDDTEISPEADSVPTETEGYAAAPLKDLSTDSPATSSTVPLMDEQDINLDVILDVPITISVEIGRTQVPIRDLLRYSQGSVIELDRLVSEPLDVLVNNAGQFGVKPFLETTGEDLDQFYNSNLRGTFFTSQAVVPEMIKAKRGSIISIGTTLVNHGMADAPVTGPMTSKGGIHALSVSLAAELAQHNVRVNVVAPGIIRTPLIGEGADSFAPIHPLGRIGEVEDISDAVAYIAQAEFVTGTVLEVDGGYTHGR